MATVTFRIWRGDASGGDFSDYETDVTEGMPAPTQAELFEVCFELFDGLGVIRAYRVA